MNQKIERLLTDLQTEATQGIPIIVEGKKDVEALEGIGVEGNFHQLSLTSLSELAERISREYEEVIILTDFDDFGEKAAEKLKDFFLNEALEPDLSYRRRFRRLLGVAHFEQLPALLAQEQNQ